MTIAGAGSAVAARQAALRRLDRRDPAAARIVDAGRTIDRMPGDAVHTAAVPGAEYAVEIPVGTLAMDRGARVGFQAMRSRTRLLVAPGTPTRALRLLHAAAERSCVVLDTLRRGVDVTSDFDVGGV